MDTKDTQKRAGEDPSTEPQSKWQKASGKGDSNQGDQAVQDQRSQKGAHETGSEASRHIKPTCSWTWASTRPCEPR